MLRRNDDNSNNSKNEHCIKVSDNYRFNNNNSNSEYDFVYSAYKYYQSFKNIIVKMGTKKIILYSFHLTLIIQITIVALVSHFLFYFVVFVTSSRYLLYLYYFYSILNSPKNFA